MTRRLGRLLMAASLAVAAVGIAVPPAGAAPLASPVESPCVPILNCNPAASLAKDAAKAAAEATLQALVKWVSDGAVAVLDRIGQEIDQAVEPHLDALWFAKHEKVMRTVALLVVLPLLLCALIGAVIHQDPGRLVRAVAVYLPVAVLGGFVAVQLTQLALAVTDQLCLLVSQGMGNDVHHAVFNVGAALQAVAAASANPLAGGFLTFVVALLVVVAAVLIWLELLLRSAAIYVAVMFLPLTLAGLVWPATARWAKRLVEILVALILSKFVVVAVISLAISGLGAGLSAGPTDGLAAGFSGAALLLLAGFAPFVLLRLVPVVEAGVIAHLEGTSRRPVEAGVTSSQMVHRMVQSSGAGAGDAAAAAPAVGGAAAASMIAAKAVGHPGFLDGLSDAVDHPSAGTRSHQPIAEQQSGGVLTATGAEGEAGGGDRD
jgi:hypothetical protein